MTHAERMTRFAQSDLYVVITEQFCAGRPALTVLDEVLAAGVRIVQLREPAFEDRKLYERAIAFREKTQRAEALLIIDNRIDIAFTVGADGVHLGHKDLPVDAVRRIAPNFIIGASTHSMYEALMAEKAGASYVNIGPIFPTKTKNVPSGVLGPDIIDSIVPRLTIPWTTMGGIKLNNIEQVLARGAKHVAVVTAVTEAPDIRAAAQELKQVIRRFRHGGV